MNWRYGSVPAIVRSLQVPTGVYALWCPHHGRYVRMNADGNMDWSDPKGKDEFPSDWTWEVFTAVDAGDGEIALWSESRGAVGSHSVGVAPKYTKLSENKDPLGELLF